MSFSYPGKWIRFSPHITTIMPEMRRRGRFLLARNGFAAGPACIDGVLVATVNGAF